MNTVEKMRAFIDMEKNRKKHPNFFYPHHHESCTHGTKLIPSHDDVGGPNDEDDGRYDIEATTKERVDNACCTFFDKFDPMKPIG